MQMRCQGEGDHPLLSSKIVVGGEPQAWQPAVEADRAEHVIHRPRLLQVREMGIQKGNKILRSGVAFQIAEACHLPNGLRQHHHG